MEPTPNATLVPVLETTERTLLPLAEAALTQEGIDYAVEHRGMADQIFGQRSSATIGETDEPFAVVVRSEDAARARQLLDTLTASPVAIGPSVTEAKPSYSGASFSRPSAGMVALFDAATGQHVGSLTDAQFADVSRHLERESTTDDDYYLSNATLDMLAEASVDPATLALLRHALGGRDGMDIRWVRPEAQTGGR
jgi:processive 1,2-diacylglycerol beta-glucosyltransferase